MEELFKRKQTKPEKAGSINKLTTQKKKKKTRIYFY
jgi:hypothetical protein